MNKATKAFILFLIATYLTLVFVLDYGSDNENSNYKEKIEQLETKNKLLQAKNEEIDAKVNVLDQNYDSLNLAIIEVEEIKTQLKEEKNEKINRVNGMDHNELYSFFANFKTEGTTD